MEPFSNLKKTEPQRENGILLSVFRARTRPVKFGGIAFQDPIETGISAFATSRNATEMLRRAICSGYPVQMSDHSNHCRSATNAAGRLRDETASALRQEHSEFYAAFQKRTLSKIMKGNTSGWLTVLPLAAVA